MTKRELKRWYVILRKAGIDATLSLQSVPTLKPTAILIASCVDEDKNEWYLTYEPKVEPINLTRVAKYLLDVKAGRAKP